MANPANERPGRYGADMQRSRPDSDRIPDRNFGDYENWNDLGGTGVRYGGSSSGGYGTGGAALDYRDVVGSRYDWEHRYSDVRQVFQCLRSRAVIAGAGLAIIPVRISAFVKT
jgi:hypothetical protein